MCLIAKRLKLALYPMLFLFSAGALAEAQLWQTNMSPGVTEVSREVYDLHMTILIICVVIGVVVFGAMFYSVFAHRKSKGAVPATFHESTKVEIAWTIVPFLILLFMAVPATSTLLKIYNADDAEMDIVVTGYQWKWKYEYLDPNGDNVSFFSSLSSTQDEIWGREEKGEHYLLEVDEPLVIPVNKKVRFLVTANDVIHSWWVPKLAVKKDAIPGFVNEAWTLVEEEGIYRGQCAELCGKDHGFMPIVVNVTSEEEFNSWLAEKKQAAAAEKALASQVFTLEELVTRGEEVYNKACVACHGPTGDGVPGVFPALKGSPMATGPINAHLDMVVNGSKNNPAMQAFGAQLSELDLAAVVTYERNAWGNNMGDMLQPADVANFKKGQ
jgi:cytochrome c oxidase subunit 2